MPIAKKRSDCDNAKQATLSAAQALRIDNKSPVRAQSERRGMPAAGECSAWRCRTHRPVFFGQAGRKSRDLLVELRFRS